MMRMGCIRLRIGCNLGDDLLVNYLIRMAAEAVSCLGRYDLIH